MDAPWCCWLAWPHSRLSTPDEECHTANSREAGGVEALAQVLPKSKVMEEERQAGAAEQTHAALQALSLAVSADALCKEACIDQAMDRLAYCMRDDEVGRIHHAAHPGTARESPLLPPTGYLVTLLRGV
jgi:hypothetical protein